MSPLDIECVTTILLHALLLPEAVLLVAAYGCGSLQGWAS